MPSSRASTLRSAHALEERPAGSDDFPVHEVPEDSDPAYTSEALCVPHDPFIPAAQSDANLFYNSELDAVSDFLPDSNALPLQDQVPSLARCLVQRDSGATVSGAFCRVGIYCPLFSCYGTTVVRTDYSDRSFGSSVAQCMVKLVGVYRDHDHAGRH